jgi:hypothetical protein
VAAPAARGAALPQDASAVFTDELLDVTAYVMVQGLAERGEDVAQSWIQSRVLAAGIARTLSWNAARFAAQTSGSLTQARASHVGRLLPALLSSSMEAALNAPLGETGATHWKHAVAGFFSIPGAGLSVLFACGPIEIAAIVDDGQLAFCRGNFGPEPFSAADLVIEPSLGAWHRIVGVVSDCRAGRSASGRFWLAELDDRGRSDELERARDLWHLLNGQGSASFAFERPAPRRSNHLERDAP